MSSHITILRGISGSGKSTYAQEYVEQHIDTKIISRDIIRKELLGEDGLKRYFEEKMDYNLEEYITNIELYRLAKYLAKHKDIIIDNTCLKRKYIQEYVNVFADFDVWPSYVKILDFDVPLEECKKRVAARQEKPIADDVIEKQYEQFRSLDWNIENFYQTIYHNTDDVFVEKAWKTTRDKRKWQFCEFEINKYIPNKEKQKAIIVDIDGTMAHRKILFEENIHMRSYYDYEQCDTDILDEAVAKVASLCASNGILVIFTSGRKESARNKTIEWLRKNFMASSNMFKLIMRNDGDDRNDAVVKYELFNEYIRDNYNVLFAIDDRDRVVAMWEELGLKVLNVGKINEHF